MFKKTVLVASILLSSLLLTGCSLKSKPAALQVNTTPSASIFVDGKLLGKSPYSTDSLKAGEVIVKLVPDSSTESLVGWEGKVKLVGGVLTLIDREFATTEANASGQILSLEKVKDKNSALISVVSDPDGALVKIDGETKGFTPLSLDNVTAGDHEVVISKENYADKSLRVKNVSGYRLIMEVKLGQNELPVVSVTPTVVPTGAKATVSISPTAKPSPKATSGASSTGGSVLIKDTETGFLRVRSTPSGTEVARVKPGETYPLLEEKSGWYKITYEEGKEGWISSTYAQKVE